MNHTDKRFSRLEIALGEEAILRLRNSHVTIVGIGGVGGIAAETLVRSAVGHLKIIDFDSFQETDINRQNFALVSTMGEAKVNAAATRLLDINPELDISTLQEFFHSDCAQVHLTPKPDFVIDAIDAVLPKVELLAYCHRNSIPVISVMGAASHHDFSLIKVTDIKKTQVCPLARVIRRRLRRRGIEEGIACLFSAEPGPPFIQPKDIGDDDIKSASIRGRPRPILGSYGPLITVFGVLAADYVIRSLIKKQQVSRA
ncbi:ThiF family adenylyltransferase [bacterium]|nr:ThiF family adenylyltransferase [bacterium]